MRVLLVSYFYPPARTVGVVRIGTLVKYWTRGGVDVTVVRSDDLLGAGSGALGESDVSSPATVVVAPTWPGSGAVASSRGLLRRADALTQSAAAGRPSGVSLGGIVTLARRLRDHVLFPDIAILWLPSAVREAVRLHKACPFDVVFASGNPWSNLVIADAIARRIGVPFVADFRDPWGDGPLYSGRAGWTAIERLAHTRLERWVCEDAAFVSATTQKIGDAIAGRCALQAAPQIIENGFDAEESPAPSPPAHSSVFRIVMTSSFRAGERFMAFARALGRCIERGAPDGRKVMFSFAGRSRSVGDPTTLADCFGAAGIASVLDDRGFLPRPEALALQQAADLLVFVETPFRSVPGGMVGTEFYEYMSTGRRILLLDEADSAVWQVGAPAGTVRRYDRDDVPGIEAALWDAMVGRWTSAPDWMWIRRFARGRQAERLQRVLEAAMGRGPPA